METQSSLYTDTYHLGITVIMILLNGFFVAAEFALVKLNRSKINGMVKEGRPFATVALWLYERQNLALSACQLGITMASLALGWIGEPAVAHMITPVIHSIGITSEALLHGIAFTIAFTLITSLHIIIGEQVPKIYAIRKADTVFLYSSLILKGFYIILYPFMYVLNRITMVILRWIGVTDADSHEAPLSEDEIQASLSLSHASGELTKNEARMINAVFKFDDEVVSHIMLPRGDIEFLNIKDPFTKNLENIKEMNHSRFPLCEDSLDNILGVVHIKDLLGFDQDDDLDLKSIMRPPIFIYEKMGISQLLQEFKQLKQHLAFVQDEHGTILGIVTLEDVLEELVGSLDDEFDIVQPEFLKEAENRFLVDGDIQLDRLNDRFKIKLFAEDADTLAGLIIEKAGYKLSERSTVIIQEGLWAEILKIDGVRASKVRLIFSEKEIN